MDALTFVVSPRARHQVALAEALQLGLARHGVQVHLATSARDAGPVVGCWGWRHGARLHAQGHEVLVAERGYLGDRFAWTSLGWNGLNGRASFHLPDDGGQRFERHFGGLMRPWRNDGHYALLIGQVPGDMSLQGRDIDPWYQYMAHSIRLAHPTLMLRFREHPEVIRHGGVCRARGIMRMNGELSAALAESAAVFTWNSNTAVEAVLAGVPAVTMDEGSMAWAVTGHSVGEIIRPDRSAWAARLAWTQWTMDEIESGDAWTVVRAGIEL